MARLNDTEAAIAAGVPGQPTQKYASVSVNVRQIDNGFLVEKSVCKDGEYKSSCVFSPVHPTLELEPHSESMGRNIVGDSSLATAAKSIRGR